MRENVGLNTILRYIKEKLDKEINNINAKVELFNDSIIIWNLNKFIKRIQIEFSLDKKLSLKTSFEFNQVALVFDSENIKYLTKIHDIQKRNNIRGEFYYFLIPIYHYIHDFNPNRNDVFFVCRLNLEGHKYMILSILDSNSHKIIFEFNVNQVLFDEVVKYIKDLSIKITDLINTPSLVIITYSGLVKFFMNDDAFLV